MNITDIYSAFRYIGIRSTTMSRFLLMLTDGETFFDLGYKSKCNGTVESIHYKEEKLCLHI